MKRSKIALRKKHKDPSGGLSDAGIKYYNKKHNSNLKPGVRKSRKDMSAEEMRRKGSFLRRHYGRSNPHPVKNKKGEPTRYALQANKWGETPPKSVADVRRLARKGTELLQKSKKMKKRAAEDQREGLTTGQALGVGGAGLVGGSLGAIPANQLSKAVGVPEGVAKADQALHGRVAELMEDFDNPKAQKAFQDAIRDRAAAGMTPKSLAMKGLGLAGGIAGAGLAGGAASRYLRDTDEDYSAKEVAARGVGNYLGSTAGSWGGMAAGGALGGMGGAALGALAGGRKGAIGGGILGGLAGAVPGGGIGYLYGGGKGSEMAASAFSDKKASIQEGLISHVKTAQYYSR